MNWYCLACGCVWFATGHIPETCSDCGSNGIESQSALTERFVRERLLPLPDAYATLLPAEGSERAFVRWMCERLHGNLDLQDMILNGPLGREGERSDG